MLAVVTLEFPAALAVVTYEVAAIPMRRGAALLRVRLRVRVGASDIFVPFHIIGASRRQSRRHWPAPE
jgi:uncharacterized membrane protein YobD (UPF0266 family)